MCVFFRAEGADDIVEFLALDSEAAVFYYIKLEH